VIIRQADDSLYLITQPDHAHLAGRVMAQALGVLDHPRRASIVHAVAEHDNGWAEEDAAPTVDPVTRAVVDFVHAPLAVRHAVWPRAVARLQADPWAAALVAQHAITVYDRFRPDPAWGAFFAEMEAARDRLRQQSGLPFGELLADYVFVRLGDLISLTFCTGWTDEQQFGDWRVRRDGARVIVSPDPFSGQELPLEIEARAIPNQPLRSNEDLRDALARGQRIQLCGTVQGGEP
jgi:hypothetical protein